MLPRLFALASLLLAAACANAARDDAARIARIVDPIVEAEMRSVGIPGAAFVFVRDGRVVYRRGYGVSDVASATPADPERTVWPIASITKTVTALAVLQQVDRGRLALDADVNSSLRRLSVPDAGLGRLTLRHLLSHSGGLDELPGRQHDGAPPPDLVAFLGPRLVRYRAPGRLTAYSTYGIALAGLLLEDVSGEAYADYVRRNIFAPLGMARSRIMVRRGDEAGVATPYRIEDGRAEPAPHEYYVTLSTSSMAASASDMARLLLMHLGDGAIDGRRLLSARLAREMRRQQATNHPALPGWSLGFQLDRVDGLDLAEHGGDIGGFSSLFTLIPELGAGFFIVHHGEGGDLRYKVREALLTALRPPRPRAVPAPDPARRQELLAYAGRYLVSTACRSCPGDADVFTLTVTEDGALSLWGRRWLPLGGDLFVRQDGRRLLGFARDEAGRIVSVTGGSWRVADRLED
jgi:CubicO group peptidase (beta-lactamase class C family)